MKSPVEHVKISAKGKEILIKIKRNTGLEHWNQICRIAFCRSLANTTYPTKFDKTSDNAIDIEWKTFAGIYDNELAALFYIRALIDKIDINNKDEINEYFRSHIERGLVNIQNTKHAKELVYAN